MAQEMITRTDKWNYMKFKRFCTANEMIGEVGGNIANYVSNERLVKQNTQELQQFKRLKIKFYLIQN